MTKRLLCLGYGFSARVLAPVLQTLGWSIAGTTRNPARVLEMHSEHVEPILWPGDDLHAALSDASHLLISAAPSAQGDPFLSTIDLAQHEFSWVGYLSTTGVYGNHDGAWVDETAPLTPTTQRGQHRVQAEAAWAATNLPVHIFRLAGIYGPGRGPFSKVRNGTARRIIKPGQMFSRIHVDDIAQVVAASIAQPRPGAIYNLCDDDPAPPQDVLAYAARLLNMPLPPAVDFAIAEMTSMARSFYAENKRVRNDLIKSELSISLKHPSYKEGLQSLLELET